LILREARTHHSPSSSELVASNPALTPSNLRIWSDVPPRMQTISGIKANPKKVPPAACSGR